MARVGEATIEITTRENVGAGIGKSTSRLNAFASRVAAIGRKIALAMAAMVAAVAASLTALTVSSFNQIDAAAKTADKLGLTINALRGLNRAAGLAGVGVDKFNMGLQRMVRRIAEAANGTGEAKSALEELGLDAVALNQMTPDQAFLAIADAMGQVTGQSNRVRLAFKLFDSEGVDLVNVLNQGSDAIREQINETDRLRGSMSRVDAARIERANDAWDDLKTAIAGIGDAIAIEVADPVTNAAEVVTNAVVRIRAVVTSLATGIREGFRRITQTVSIAVDIIRASFELIPEMMKLMKAQVVQAAANITEPLVREFATGFALIRKQIDNFINGRPLSEGIAKELLRANKGFDKFYQKLDRSTGSASKESMAAIKKRIRELQKEISQAFLNGDGPGGPELNDGGGGGGGGQNQDQAARSSRSGFVGITDLFKTIQQSILDDEAAKQAERDRIAKENAEAAARAAKAAEENVAEAKASRMVLERIHSEGGVFA